MEKPRNRAEREADRLEVVERRLRVATQAVRLTREVATLFAVIGLTAL